MVLIKAGMGVSEWLEMKVLESVLEVLVIKLLLIRMGHNRISYRIDSTIPI